MLKNILVADENYIFYALAYMYSSDQWALTGLGIVEYWSRTVVMDVLVF